jgi:hypothetical protein
MMRSSPAPAISIPATIILNRRHLWPLWPSVNQATAVQTPAISRSRKATSATVTLVVCEKARRGFTQATVLSNAGREPSVLQPLSRSLALRSRVGCRSLEMARASIWRIRSRVRSKRAPTSSRVRGSARSRPKRI